MAEKTELSNTKGCSIVGIGCGILFLLICAAGWLWDVSGAKEWFLEWQDQNRTEQIILEVLDDGTERTCDEIGYEAKVKIGQKQVTDPSYERLSLSQDNVLQALRRLEKRKRIKQNHKPLHSRKYHIVW